MVTGGSDGIGQEFCIHLASKGFNICLVSRTEKKLKLTEDLIKKEYPKVQTRIVVADFSQKNFMAFYMGIVA